VLERLRQSLLKPHPKSSQADPARSARTALDQASVGSEWRLVLDANGHVQEAQHGSPGGDPRVSEVLERLRKGTVLGSLDASMRDAMSAAASFGVSGRRIAFLPDTLSQPVPVFLEIVRSGSRSAGFIARVSSIRSGPSWSDELTGLSSSELLALSAAAAIASDSPPEAIVDSVMPLLLDALNARSGFVFVRTTHGRELELIGEYGSAWPGDRPSLPDDAVMVLAERNMLGAFAYLGADDQRDLMRRRPDGRDTHVMQLLTEGSRPVAAIWLTLGEGGSPQASRLASVQPIATLLALRLQVGLLKQQVQNRSRDLETAFTVTSAISHSLDIESKFHEIAVNAARVIEGSSCLFLELDSNVKDLVPIASSDMDSAHLAGLRFRFANAEDAEKAMSEKTPMVIEDLQGEYGVDPQLQETLAMRSAVFVPIYAQNAPMGSLLLYSRKRNRRYSDEELRMAEHIADQAGSAIENARLYRDLAVSQSRIRALLHRVSLVREQERSGLASVVHDEITQAMVGAIYELQSLASRLDSRGRDQVARAISILRDATGRSREVISSLKFPLLEELGLPAALRTLLNEFREETGLRCTLECSGTRQVDKAIETTLFRIAREAISNVRRHAAARSVRVELVYDKDQVALSVIDDGRGLVETEVQDDRDHFGILVMQEQAAALGGECMVEPGRRRGTVVRASLPIPRSSDGE
jgi:signal transduction histidine kinase